MGRCPGRMASRVSPGGGRPARARWRAPGHHCPVESRMIQSRFNRLTQMTFEECAWRARVVARTHADRFRVRLRTPRWEREDLQRVLAASAVGTFTNPAIAHKDWAVVRDSLVHSLRQRDGDCAL